MHSFNIVSEYVAQFKVDTRIYSHSVINKVTYWLSKDYTVTSFLQGSNIFVEIESQGVHDWITEKKNISKMFIDFQMREIIEFETRDIRRILYIKAFANIEDFMEYEDD